MRIYSILAVLLCLTPPAMAETRIFEGLYDLTLRRIPFATLSLRVELSEDSYALSTYVSPNRVMRAFSSAQAIAVTRGDIINGQFRPSGYQSAWINDEKGLQRAELIYRAGVPIIFNSDWRPDPDEPEPVIIDPVDISKVGGGTRDLFAATVQRVVGFSLDGACTQSVRLFDGRRLARLTPHPREQQGAQEHGLAVRGPVILCDFAWKPIGGYRQETMESADEIEPAQVYLGRLPFSEYLVPALLEIPTTYGTIRLEALQFPREVDAPSTAPYDLAYLMATRAPEQP